MPAPRPMATIALPTTSTIATPVRRYTATAMTAAATGTTVRKTKLRGRRARGIEGVAGERQRDDDQRAQPGNGRPRAEARRAPAGGIGGQSGGHVRHHLGIGGVRARCGRTVRDASGRWYRGRDDAWAEGHGPLAHVGRHLVDAVWRPARSGPGDRPRSAGTQQLADGAPRPVCSACRYARPAGMLGLPLCSACPFPPRSQRPACPPATPPPSPSPTT